jgi:hypothetical protein
MALIDDDSCCTLCGELLGDSSNWIATTMAGLRPPLSRMDDSAAHHSCLRDWEHKCDFVDAYNLRCGKPELIIADDGHVRYIRLDPPLIAWYEWLAMPVLLPVSLSCHAIVWLRERWTDASSH